MPIVKCYHNEVAPLRTVRHERQTQGKRSFGCSDFLDAVDFSIWVEGRSCGFFKWADMTDNINELELLLFE
ncbi:Endonuclease 8-like 3 [Bienertia sinuspersici]